jgi:glycerol kinase
LKKVEGFVMDKKYLIALDQGTTSSRAIIFDTDQNIIQISSKEVLPIFPKPGWVEQDPMAIYSSQYGVMMEVLAQSGIPAEAVAGIGITNQRETTIVWNKSTGKPIYNAIVWQCRRTSELCEDLKAKMGDYIRENTGLVVDAYFSATKVKWILDNVPGAMEQAKNGELLFGTVDTWLIWKLTAGKVFITDYTNASRTMLYNIKDLCWDQKICNYLGIATSMLPKVCNSSQIYGYISLQGTEVPLAGLAGDQQAALFGQTCFNEGDVKNTYGTGCFLLMNTGKTMCHSTSGLITTIAIGLNDKITYALEGSVFVGGAVVQWLRDEMRFIIESCDSEYFATKITDNGGVYFVPAFTGLGAPYWDMYARGAIIGLTRGTTRNHIIRAALESIAYQVNDVIEAMHKDTGVAIRNLKVDGGASKNNFLMQFQADIMNSQVRRPKILETTALGAAYLAGLAVGVWKGLDDIKDRWTLDHEFESTMMPDEREKLIHKWHRAVERTRNWEED